MNKSQNVYTFFVPTANGKEIHNNNNNAFLIDTIMHPSLAMKMKTKQNNLVMK